MTVASFVDVCRFLATSNGTGDFVVSAAVTGYQTPASAGATSGNTYHYRAESADLTQWEVGQGTYTSGTVTIARTTILFSSTGSKVSFTNPPQVALVLLAEDTGALQPGQIPGLGSNVAANAGNVGEFISSNIVQGSGVSMVSGTAINITSISLTAGDWQVWGNIYVQAGANIIQVESSISTVSNTHPTRPGGGSMQQWVGTSASQIGVGAGPIQQILNSTTTIFLVGSASFASGSGTGYGFIGARRMR